MKFAVILGTRPEIIKMSPIIRELQKKKSDYFIIHSNQHYSKEMDRVFFKQLELPKPKYNLEVGSNTHAKMTAKILQKIEPIIIREKPDIILIEGDTNTVMAAALASAKLNIKIAHIEAGLRSYDRAMPEEINRIITDHISDYLFPPTKKSAEILLNEGINKNKIFTVGNSIVDAVYQNLKIAKKHSKMFSKLKIKPNQYFLLTLHRPSNVDDKKTFQDILDGLKLLINHTHLPIIFPIHPRTKNQIKKFKLKIPKEIRIIPPVGYLEFLQLEKNAKLILTDSGGIQEEACILKVPSITLRENTERPEAIDVGAGILAGTNPNKILNSAKKMTQKSKNWKNPFGKGDSAKKIIKILFS